MSKTPPDPSLSLLHQVGVKIDTSSFSLTRIVTFMPFYMLVNRTKQTVLICEEGQENWTVVPPEQVRACILRAVFMHDLSQFKTVPSTSNL